MALDRPKAPDDLRPLEDFCNSARFLYDEDAFRTRRGAADWLRERGVSDADPTEREVADLVRFREALRAHLDGRDRAAAEVLNEFAEARLTGPRWGEDGRPVLPATEDTGVAGLLGELLGVLFQADISGRLARLKICQAPECRWAFYDRSPGGNSVWCSMEICGARHKMRSYRSRATRRNVVT